MFSLADSVVSFQDTRDFYQFNITLSKPPLTNLISLNLVTEGLEFYYQPPLDMELRVDGERYDYVNATHGLFKGEVVTYRPENVVGSYAVYMTNPKSGSTGKLYHIYRPLIIDANGLTVWGDMTVTKTGLSIAIDDKFLAEAAYPVVVDPTFGYTSIGASTDNIVTANALFAKFTLTEDGTATKITAYLNDPLSDGADCKAAIYSESGTAPTDLIINSGVTAVSGAAWYNFTIDQALVAAEYWITVIHDTQITQYFDSTGGTSEYEVGGISYPNFPDPATTENWSEGTLKVSIYVTYTASGGPTAYSFNLTGTVALTSALSSSKALMRSFTQTIITESTLYSTKTITALHTETITYESTRAATKSVFATVTETVTLVSVLTSQKAISNIFTETVNILSVIEIEKHVSATLIEIAETLQLTSVLTATFNVDITGEEALGFAVIAFLVACTALSLVMLKKKT